MGCPWRRLKAMSEKTMTIRISSRIFSDAEQPPEQTVAEYPVRCVRRGGSLLLDFSSEYDSIGCRECYILSSDGRLSVKRRGAIICDMLFLPGGESRGTYNVSGMVFDMRINTEYLRAEERGSEFKIALRYEMEFGGDVRITEMEILVF